MIWYLLSGCLLLLAVLCACGFAALVWYLERRDTRMAQRHWRQAGYHVFHGMVEDSSVVPSAENQ